MSELSDFLDGFTELDRKLWYKKQVALASLMIAGLIRRFGITNSTQIPDAHEVVSETVLRVNDANSPRYVWDEKNPPTLNQFFARCMRTTISSLRAKERSHASVARRIAMAVAAVDPVGTAGASIEVGLSGDAVSKRLDALLQGRRMRGRNLEYIRNIEVYASGQNTQHEIANDLGVKPSTVETFRKRAAILLREIAINTDKDDDHG